MATSFAERLMRPAPGSDTLRYIARQPILDRCGRTFAYELLFRSGGQNAFHSGDGDCTSQTVIDNVFLLGRTAALN